MFIQELPIFRGFSLAGSASLAEANALTGPEQH
jgi:hypothetical protein